MVTPAATLDAPLPGAAPVAWPALREELRLYRGPSDARGQPSWTLHDPVRHRFVRLDWVSHEVLRRWWLGDAALIAQQVNAETTLHLDAGDVLAVLELALREELVLPVRPSPAQRRAPGGAAAALQWLLHHYLFFRIPLWRPDAWLGRALPWLRALGSPAFTRLSAAAGLLGLWGVLQQHERLSAQWLDLLSWQGLALYGATLVGVKVCHELGHALVAKAQGLRVPTMGVAFMVLWPVAYTDTTEAWRLADAAARRRIAAAGVRTELTLAAWATLAWSLLPPGPLSTAAFVIATMTWVATLAINLSPFMRFDGYFLLSDALDLPNLHERSFALARWWLRRVVLGWDSLQPEPEMSPRWRHGLIAFALLTWVYRLFLYLGIAWLVYQIGFKVLGLLLLAVELGWFIAAPLAREGAQWWKAWPRWRGQRRARQTAAGLLVLLLAGFWPWRAQQSGAALLQPAQHLALRLPAAVVLDTPPPVPGQSVRAGQVLLRAVPPALQQQASAAQARVQQLEREVAGAALGGGEAQGQWGSLQAALAAAREQALAVQEELARFAPEAPFDGVVVDVHPGWRAGHVSPPPREALLHLAAPGRWQVVAYADEATAQALRPGDAAGFMADARPFDRVRATVLGVAAQPSSVVPEAALVRPLGGAIEAKEASGGWVPAQALYRVELQVDGALPLSPRAWRGHVAFEGPARSLWQRAWLATQAGWVREAGF